MTLADVGALMAGVAPALREYIVSAQKALSDRIAAIESQDLIPGERGPAGEKGASGNDGRDGTLENLKIIRQDERTLVFCFKDGTPIEGGVVRLNHPVFQGTYSDEATYLESDLVQWDGSGWIAVKDSPPMKPGTGKPEVTGWKLWIKRGNEGKPGPKGGNGTNGTNGAPGRDGRNLQ